MKSFTGTLPWVWHRKWVKWTFIQWKKLRQNAGFQELSSLHFALDHLSTRRHFTRLDWINKQG
jgi:hypothetical protein